MSVLSREQQRVDKVNLIMSDKLMMTPGMFTAVTLTVWTVCWPLSSQTVPSTAIRRPTESCTNHRHRSCLSLGGQDVTGRSLSQTPSIWSKWHLDHNSHVTHERLSHAVIWPLLRAHATPGDEQQQAKGTAERCVELVLPTAPSHPHALWLRLARLLVVPREVEK